MAAHVIGLDHVVFNCADIERSLRWYHDKLGLDAERVDEWRRGEVLFPSVRVDPTTVIDLFPALRDGTNVNHVCLVVDPVNLDELATEFPGARRADGLFGAQGFASSVYVEDPDGNTIELRYYER
jgi:catechol 2,3-dioxygenase-like lactoylglutathione lyase family enzyme